jgi:hypothetical protein
VETNLQEFLNDPRYEELIEDVRGMLKRMVGKEESEYLIALQDLQMGLLDYGKKFQPSLRCIIAVRKVVEETFNKRRINKVFSQFYDHFLVWFHRINFNSFRM